MIRTAFLHVGRGTLLSSVSQRVRGKHSLRRLRPEPDLREAQVRHSPRRINSLLAVMGGRTTYLEIGVHSGWTLENITATRVVGVDPEPRFDLNHLPLHVECHRTTSDDYFANICKTQFDVIFLDGLHTWQQTYRDLINGLSRLNKGGAILIDDTLPVDAVSAIPDQLESYRQRREAGIPGGPWHGDVWKLLLLLELGHPELQWRTIASGGNGQTLLWRSQDGVQSFAIAQNEVLQQVDEANFQTEFNDPLPNYLRASTEQSAIKVWESTRFGVRDQ